MITELSATGQKTKTKVFAGGAVVAEQQLYNEGQQSIVWKHVNPVTATAADSGASGEPGAKQEFDPFGLELGSTDPYLQNAEPDYASMGGSFYRDGGNPFGGGNGCDWDGMQVPCHIYEFAINSGYIHNPGQQRGFNQFGGPSRFNQPGMGTRTNRFDNAAEYGDSIDAWQSPLWIGGEAIGDGLLGEGHFAHAPQDSGHEFAHSAVRCPPTGKQLAGNPTVKKAINEAFKRADQFRNERGYWVEHGGWIYQNRKTGRISTFIKTPDTSPPLPRNYPYQDYGTGVYLHSPPSRPVPTSLESSIYTWKTVHRMNTTMLRGIVTRFPA